MVRPRTMLPSEHDEKDHRVLSIRGHKQLDACSLKQFNTMCTQSPRQLVFLIISNSMSIAGIDGNIIADAKKTSATYHFIECFSSQTPI